MRFGPPSVPAVSQNKNERPSQRPDVCCQVGADRSDPGRRSESDRGSRLPAPPQPSSPSISPSRQAAYLQVQCAPYAERETPSEATPRQPNQRYQGECAVV